LIGVGDEKIWNRNIYRAQGQEITESSSDDGMQTERSSANEHAQAPEESVSEYGHSRQRQGSVICMYGAGASLNGLESQVAAEDKR